MKAARKYGISVLGSDVNKNAPALEELDGNIVLPSLDSISFIDDLIANIKVYNIKLIVPTRDDELLFLSKFLDRIHKAGAIVLCNLPDVTLELVDKGAFATFCINKLGFIDIKVVNDPKDAVGTDFPLFFRGGRSRKTLKVKIQNKAELTAAFTLSPDGVATSFLNGREISIDAYVSRLGRILYCVPRTRDIVLGGECIVSTTIDSNASFELTRQIVTKSKIVGPLVIQGMLNAERVTPFEINLRFGGASHLSFKAAYSGPELAIREYIIGEELIKSYEYKRNYQLFKDFKEIYTFR